MSGPDFRRPQVNVPAQWDAAETAGSAIESVATTNPTDVAEWWKSFDDPTLTSLVERAIQSNLDLQQAEARIRQARAARQVVAAGLWPQVDVSASYSRSGTGASSRGTTISGGGTGNTGGTGGSGSSISVGGSHNLFQAGLDAAWELDFFGGTRRNIEASEADIQAALEDRRSVMVTLAAEVGTNYMTMRANQWEIAIARRNLISQQHTADITRKRFEAGYVGALDVANAQAQVATTESQIPPLESLEKGAIYSISILLGLEPGALVEELSAEAPIPPSPPEIPVGLPSELLRRRPDIRSAEAQLHAATARIGVATADLFPKFSLTGSFGVASTSLASLMKWSSAAWSYGPSVTWPIFDAGRIRGNIEIQNALQEQSLAVYRKTILIALQDVETALVNYAKEQDRRKALQDAVTNSTKAVEYAMKLYVAGRTDFLNVLNAQRTLYVSEQSLAQSTRVVATDLIALYKALGGGWESGW